MKFLQLSLAAGLLFSVSYSAWASDQLWIIGGPNGWDPNQENAEECTATDVAGVFTYVWDKTEADQNNFGFVDGGFGSWDTLNPKRYGASEGNGKAVSAGETTYDAIYSNSNTWVLSTTGKYLLTFDTNSNTLKVEIYSEGGDNGDSDDSKTYEFGWALRGQFNNGNDDWSDIAFSKTDVEGVWSCTASISRASGGFGIKSLNEAGGEKTWYGCNISLSESNSSFDVKSGDNSTFKLTAGKEYTFVLDERGDVPTLSVSWVEVPDDPYPAEIVLAGANFNNWSLTDGVVFTKNEGGVYTASVASLSGEFKIVADQSWDKSWGNAEFTASSNSKVLSSGNANISIGAPYTEVQNATLTFNYDTKTLSIEGLWIQPVVETTYTLQWGTGNASGNEVTFEKDGDSGNYTCTFTPNVASGRFGINATGGNPGWYGNQNATLSESNKSVTLTANGGETSFNLTANREYTLTLDPETMQLSATWTPSGDDNNYEEYGWALNGTFASEDWTVTKFNRTDTEGVWSVVVTPSQQSGQFGVRSLKENGDQKEWYGSDGSLSEANPSMQIKTGGNSSFSLVKGRAYTFTIDETKGSPVLTITWDDADQPIGPEFESSTTIYFVNEAGWNNVYAYFYEEHPGADGKPVATTNANWPGALLQTSDDMDVKQVTLTTESGAKLENVYAITFDASKGWERLVFNNGDGGLTSGNQTADCGIEKYGVYTNASKGEGYDTNMDYNMTGPIAYSVAGYYYVSQQSAANEEFVCYYNDHAGFEGSDKWDNCWLYIYQGSEIIVKQKMELDENQFGRTCWIVPRYTVYLSSSLQNFYLWFNNSDNDKQGANPIANNGDNKGKGERMLNQTTLQNFEIYEDDDQSSYNGIMHLYVKGNVLVNGVSAQETPQQLSRNPQAGRFYAKVQPIDDGKFYLLRDPAKNTTVYNNFWASNAEGDVLTVGHAAHGSLAPYAGTDINEDNSLHYTLDNTPISGEESVLVVKMRDKSIHNIKPTPEFQAEYVTEMGHSELDDVNGTGKHARVQRHGGIKVNVTASNYFTDFSKCSLKFDYKPGQGGDASDVSNYVEPVYFGIHELAKKDEAKPAADLESNDSEGGTTVIGTYRVFFMTPGIYTVSLTNDNGNDPIYNQETLELDETTAYATPTSIGLQVNYADVVAETSSNADDAAKFVSNFPSYTIWFAWSDEYDSNPNIVDQLVSGADIRSGEASTKNEEYDKKAEVGADADVWYIRATPSNAHFSYSDELNADPSSFQIWVQSGMEGVVPSTSDSSTNALRRAVSNPEEAPAGYVKYDPYIGVNLSSSDNFNVIIDQNGVRSEAYNIAANRIDDVTTGVEEIEAEEAFEEEVAPVYYNLNGLMVNGENLTPGIYVEVRGSKTRKIVVR